MDGPYGAWVREQLTLHKRSLTHKRGITDSTELAEVPLATMPGAVAESAAGGVLESRRGIMRMRTGPKRALNLGQTGQADKS
jgi:hypothetical protein